MDKEEWTKERNCINTWCKLHKTTLHTLHTPHTHHLSTTTHFLTSAAFPCHHPNVAHDELAVDDAPSTASLHLKHECRWYRMVPLATQRAYFTNSIDMKYTRPLPGSLGAKKGARLGGKEGTRMDEAEGNDVDGRGKSKVGGGGRTTHTSVDLCSLHLGWPTATAALSRHNKYPLSLSLSLYANQGHWKRTYRDYVS